MAKKPFFVKQVVLNDEDVAELTARVAKLTPKKIWVLIEELWEQGHRVVLKDYEGRAQCGVFFDGENKKDPTVVIQSDAEDLGVAVVVAHFKVSEVCGWDFTITEENQETNLPAFR